MCKFLRVSKSGYYEWKTRPLSKRELFNKSLIKEIRQIHIESRENYGAVKTWKTLIVKGICCGKHRVARLRKINGIESKRRKRFKITTLSKNTEWIAPNILNRCFAVAKPDKVWVGDVTFLATRTGWLYLAAVPFERLGLPAKFLDLEMFKRVHLGDGGPHRTTEPA